MIERNRHAAGDVISIRREDRLVVYYQHDPVRRLTGETWKDSGGSTISMSATGQEQARGMMSPGGEVSMRKAVSQCTRDLLILAWGVPVLLFVIPAMALRHDMPLLVLSVAYIVFLSWLAAVHRKRTQPLQSAALACGGPRCEALLKSLWDNTAVQLLLPLVVLTWGAVPAVMLLSRGDCGVSAVVSMSVLLGGMLWSLLCPLSFLIISVEMALPAKMLWVLRGLVSLVTVVAFAGIVLAGTYVIALLLSPYPDGTEIVLVFICLSGLGLLAAGCVVGGVLLRRLAVRR